MSLKETLDRLVAEADSAAAARRLAEVGRQRQVELADRRKAVEVVDRIPAMAAEHLAVDADNLQLWRDDRVGPSLDQLQGVSEQIRLLLIEEELGHRLWVDVDTGGNWKSQNRLMFRLRGPK